MSESSDSGTFSETERAAMQQRARELAATKGVKGSAKRLREFEACIDAISQLDGTDREIAEGFHKLVTEEAPLARPENLVRVSELCRRRKGDHFPATSFEIRHAICDNRFHRRCSSRRRELLGNFFCSFRDDLRD